MRESLFSPLWHRYAKQRPQLRLHVLIQPQRYRDQIWYLLINKTQGSHFRVNNIAYQFIGRCDGQYTVQQVWDSLLESLKDDAPTQDEVIQLLNELDQRDLVRFEMLPNIPNMYRQKKEKKKRQLISHINPLAIRLPLWNPTKLLDRLSWLSKLIFNPFTLLFWGITIIIGVLSAGSNWQILSHHASTHMLTPHFLLLTWLSFPFIKFLHELGHAIAVRYWGGQVSETGITLFMLIPAPYVDASASSGFHNKYQRMLVSAIGIMIELFLAVLALIIWTSTQPGLVNDIAFVTMFICSISSLLFNGNPLLRFDAYYLMCDTFELPNLAIRSRQYWALQFKKLVLGSENVAPMSFAEGEKKWLIAYAPLSLIYIISIVSAIIFIVGKKSVLLGVLLTIFTMASILISPFYKMVKKTLSTVEAGPEKLRAKILLSSAFVTVVVFLFMIPVPLSKTAQGVVWTPEQAQIRPNTDGFIKKILVAHDQLVEPNQIIIELEDSNLITARENLINQIFGMQADQYNLIFQDPVRANNINEQIKKANIDLSHIEDRINGLNVRSQIKGLLVMPHQDDMVGTFVDRGTLLAHILNKDIIIVRVAIPESDTALIQEKLKQVELRTAENPKRVIFGTITMDTPAVTRTLPSAALGNLGGGIYITDPIDKDGLTSIEPLVLMDITLPKTELKRIGGRVNVRFNLGFEPIGLQTKRRLHQLFLLYFNPTE